MVGGGSGVVPLMAMMRHHARVTSKAAMRLVYSARTRDDVIYADELATLCDAGSRWVTVTLTRESSPGWIGRRGRVDAQLLADAGWPPDMHPRCYVCGSSSFVEVASSALVDLGHDPARVKTERFGPTGG
jgi:ferredoxin-NADP reductase